MKNMTLEERAVKTFPGGVNSPVRSFKKLKQFPLIIKKARKDSLIDCNNNLYIDYCTSWGALIHGHAHPAIVAAVGEAIQEGSSFGFTSEREVLLGECILERMARKNCKIRFMSSGTEATMTAIRVARGITGKDVIIKFDGNYHGHADVFLINSGSALADNSLSYSRGVPKECLKNTLSIPFNDTSVFLEIIEKYEKRIAAVIFEPVPANMGIILPKEAFLNALVNETRRIGALLIADEVYTGFRLGVQGAQEVYNVHADITVFGKIIGGGFPVAALFAKEEIMNYLSPVGEVFQAGTLSGNPISMTSGLACLKLCEDKSFYSMLEEKANTLLKPIESFIRKHDLPVCITRKGSMFSFFFTGKKEISHFKDVQECDQRHFVIFYNHLLERGVFLSPSQFEASFVSSAHSYEHLEETSRVIISVLKRMFEFVEAG